MCVRCACVEWIDSNKLILYLVLYLCVSIFCCCCSFRFLYALKNKPIGEMHSMALNPTE